MYLPTIGLEIHAELKTRTKMFCDCANDPNETRPNVNICPICTAHPGTLPVANRAAVRHVLRVGAALGGAIADFSEFDRKSYFYPDIPKGYQISQYDHPLVMGGELAGVAITRVHLEEDTARSIHSAGKSLVDFNRSGIPLMELVTEPVITSAEDAGRFARELQLLLRTLGAGEANLEKGEMRIEANISISRFDLEDADLRSNLEMLGTKVEVKNLNSFRSVERAIAYEISRQTKLLEGGGKVAQETRGWDETKQETFHQRFKEGSADYRYFPEPDLPKLYLSEIPEFSTEALRASLPELPQEHRKRYVDSFGLKEADIEFLVSSTGRSGFFDAVVRELEGGANAQELVRLAANYIVSDLAGWYTKHPEEPEYGKIAPVALTKLVRMFYAKELSSRGVKDVLAVLAEQGGDPELAAKERGLIQIHDSAELGRIVDAVLAREEGVVREYKSGKQSALQYLVGMAMKESRGAGNPLELQKLLVEKIG